MFDNQRLLHARSAIAPTDGQRLVKGCYLNRDGVELESEVLLCLKGVGTEISVVRRQAQLREAAPQGAGLSVIIDSESSTN